MKAMNVTKNSSIRSSQFSKTLHHRAVNGSTKHARVYIYIFTRLKTETPYKRDIPKDSSGQGKRVSKDRASKRSEIEGTKLFQPAL